MRYFVAVAEARNFRRAAEGLRIAQPALSARIKALETELSVRLFDRTTRSVNLTAAGRLFLDEARTVLAAAAKAEQRVRAAQGGMGGSLRVGVIAPTANAWLAAILRKFRDRFPGVELSLFDLSSTEQLRRLRERELDVGLLRPPVGHPELESRLVEESYYVLAAPAGHRLARLKTLRWEDFHGEGLVLVHPTQQHGYYDAFMETCGKAGAKPYVAQYAHDIQTKLWLISAGFGVAPTTATIGEIKRPGLVLRPLPGGLPPVHTLLVWRKEDTSALVGNFVGSFSVR